MTFPTFHLPHFTGIKTIGIALAALLAGEATSLVEGASNHPALVSGLVGGGVAVAIKLVDVWYENKKNQREAKLKETATADKVLEIEQQDKAEMRAEQQRIMREKELWWKQQNDRLKAVNYETGNRNHLAVNEIMRLHDIILGMQGAMIKAGLEVPEITFVPLTKVMMPVWEEETKMVVEAANAVHPSIHRTESDDTHATKS